MRLNTVCAAALLALLGLLAASSAGVVAMTVLVAAASIVIGIGWVRLQGLSPATAHSVIIAVAGTAAAVLAAWRSDHFLTWTATVCALGLIAVFLVELLRGTGAAHRLEALFSSASGVVLAAFGSGWVGALQLARDEHMALVGATSVAAVAAVVLAAVPWPDRVIGPLCVLVAAAIAPLVGLALREPHLLAVTALGAVAGVVVATFRRLILADGGPRTRWGAAAVGIGPVLAAGAVVYATQGLLALG